MMCATLNVKQDRPPFEDMQDTGCATVNAKHRLQGAKCFATGWRYHP